ncbi:MAG: LamG-like jellyroll fold domain-containing protein [Opitutaceae bacterium]|nr:LamG-like jellyroll fold domain-containing protein [Opitutaceae bacterium]
MNRSNDFDALLNRYVDGTATETEVSRLNELLRTDPAARCKYAELMNLDSALADAAANWAAEKEWTEPPPMEAKRRTPQKIAFPKLIRWLAVAVGVAAVGGGAWWWRTTPVAFATVASEVGAVGLSRGTTLRRETTELKVGSVELITSRGARVVIEAPAAFQFESEKRLRVMHGRVAAHVPPSAKGFTVVTPSGSAVDLGTDFGVDVSRRGAAEIHVFSGEVIAQSSGGGARQNLRDGEAFALQRGAGAPREMRSAAFIRPEEMAELSTGLVSGQRTRSDAAAGNLRRDPALIALLNFESAEKPEGTYRTVQGRWPGSHAPEFGNVGDHMKIDVGGEHAWPQFSMAAWVRIDRLGAPYQSLYHTDGWFAGDKPGQVHWMINQDMTMRLALRDNTLPPDTDDRHNFPDSRTSVLPEQGRWMHLAVVYDSAARTVRFYLNGKFDKESRQEIALPARFGPAQIGNWDSHDRKLSGRVDELLILGRAMSDDEVRALFEAGNPYR